MADEELWTLCFKVLAGPTPAAARIRRLLKIAQGYGLKCVHVTQAAEAVIAKKERQDGERSR